MALPTGAAQGNETTSVAGLVAELLVKVTRLHNIERRLSEVRQVIRSDDLTAKNPDSAVEAPPPQGLKASLELINGELEGIASHLDTEIDMISNEIQLP